LVLVTSFFKNRLHELLIWTIFCIPQEFSAYRDALHRSQAQDEQAIEKLPTIRDDEKDPSRNQRFEPSNVPKVKI
jgi:hypothetical protein